MDIDWKSIGQIVAPLAPTLGGILGGVLLPGIGGAIGTQAGQILATALGVEPTPEAVGKAIAEDPEAVAKINAAEQEASAKWAAISQIMQAQIQGNTAQSQLINATMTAEVASGQKWYAWRSLYGYSVAAEMPMVFLTFFVSLLFMHDVFALFMTSTTWLTGWYTLRLGLLGYIHSGASAEKIAAVTGQAPEGVVKTVIKAVKGK